MYMQLIFLTDCCRRLHRQQWICVMPHSLTQTDLCLHSSVRTVLETSRPVSFAASDARFELIVERIKRNLPNFNEQPSTTLAQHKSNPIKFVVVESPSTIIQPRPQVYISLPHSSDTLQLSCRPIILSVNRGKSSNSSAAAAYQLYLHRSTNTHCSQCSDNNVVACPISHNSLFIEGASCYRYPKLIYRLYGVHFDEQFSLCLQRN